MFDSVAFIGLGAMGYRMAAHLPAHIANVMVWNRTFEKAQQHAIEYGTQAVSLQDAVQADVIISCLPTSEDVQKLLDQIQPKAGSIWIDCTSGEPDQAKPIAARLAAHQVQYLDAPVSGQTIGAQNATLTFMVGGDHTTFLQAQPLLQHMGQLIQYVGESGAGFAVKAINNMLLAVNLCAVAEGFTTLKAHGVSLPDALKCINASSGKSMVTETVLPQRILNREFPLTFALPLLAKDTGIAMKLVHQAKLAAPVLAQTQMMIQAAHLTAQPDSDFSAAVKMYEQWSKITLE